MQIQIELCDSWKYNLGFIYYLCNNQIYVAEEYCKFYNEHLAEV